MEQSSKHAQPPELPLSALQRDCVGYLRALSEEIPCRIQLPTSDDGSGTIFITFVEDREEKHNYLYDPERAKWQPFQYRLPRHGAMPGLLALNEYGATDQVLAPHDGPCTENLAVHSPGELADFISFCQDASGHLELPERNVEVPIGEIFTRLGLPVRERIGSSILDLTDAAVTSSVSPALERSIFRSIQNRQITDASDWHHHAGLLRPLWPRGDRTYGFMIRDDGAGLETLQPRTDLGAAHMGLCAWVSYKRVSPLFFREYFQFTTEGREALAMILQVNGLGALRHLLETHRVSVPELLAVQRRRALEWYFTRRTLAGVGREIRCRPRPGDRLLPEYRRLLAMLKAQATGEERDGASSE